MLITNINIIRADGTLLKDMTVAVKDGCFAYIGKDKPKGEWGEVIDGKDNFLIPGLINSHTHVPMTLMRGYGDDMPLDRWLFDRIFPFEDKLSGEDVYWGSLLGIAEMLASGTTSFSDMYYFCDSIAKASLESGIKCNIGRGVSCFDDTKRFSDLPAFTEMVELVNTFHNQDNGRILIDVAPHSEYTTRPDILADIADFATVNSLRVQVHLSETRKEHLECVGRHGKTPAKVMSDCGLFELPVTAAHCVWLTDGDIKLLAENNISVAHCPQSNLKLASGIARIEHMKRMGLNIALGTDSAASNNNLDMFEEIRTASLLAKGVSLNPCALPAYEALYMATKAGAISQGREDSGDIVEGYCADFVILNSKRLSMTPCHNPLSNVVYAASGADVEMTVVDGRALYRSGEFLTIDIERVLYEVKQRVNFLLAK
jgi:5-methylthioadenosine/S-adenosylhomocysteine deaminase